MKDKVVIACLLVLSLAVPAMAKDKDSKEADRLQNAGDVLEEAINMPDGLPKDLLNKAECIVVIPSMKKFAIGIGGNYGRGAMICRGGENYTGSWGPPAMYALEGANIGFQLGGQATDFFFLVMNPKGAKSLLKSKVKLGADAAASAGPKGRDAQAATDVVMTAEILTYSRSKGLFAGISLDGSTLRSDGGANENLYGKKLTATEIIREHRVSTPSSGQKLVGVLNRASPRNLSDPKSLKK